MSMMGRKDRKLLNWLYIFGEPSFDLELRDDGIALYTKPTNPGLYVNYNSNVPLDY